LWHAAKHDSLVRRPQHFAPDISMPMVKPPFGSKKIAADFFFLTHGKTSSSMFPGMVRA
jgi:hypothetical protein